MLGDVGPSLVRLGSALVLPYIATRGRTLEQELATMQIYSGYRTNFFSLPLVVTHFFY